ncbi:MAG: hypothetical protein WC838_05045 [Candidatus Margulisiibacteriota bacterium]|jgi:hypothetical protein
MSFKIITQAINTPKELSSSEQFHLTARELLNLLYAAPPTEGSFNKYHFDLKDQKASGPLCRKLFEALTLLMKSSGDKVWRDYNSSRLLGSLIAYLSHSNPSWLGLTCAFTIKEGQLLEQKITYYDLQGKEHGQYQILLELFKPGSGQELQHSKLLLSLLYTSKLYPGVDFGAKLTIDLNGITAEVMD